MNIFNRSKIYLAKYRKVVYNVCKRLYKKPVKKRKITTTKKILWICLANGILWVWCSYVLAFVGMFRDNYTGASIAESLSSVAVTEIIGVVLVYCLKSLFEKRKDFGEVGKDESL